MVSSGSPQVFYSWEVVWDAALRAFNVAMEASRKSQLPVHDHLGVFGNARGCSLVCDVFLRISPGFYHETCLRIPEEINTELVAANRGLRRGVVLNLRRGSPKQLI
ncbi:hypothetical protein MPDQ_000923 [Monascus purpureus]|uniref:Uncharacterized protein n=1 Tax=Monascus purpureus TaxID=5098 RepID=A0A507QSE1_MONPU|nr:hypothetical protein MPDQ_000923 [Monascus purpureus]BDD62559.1 hypothetical protein MAP00_007528 [Monascus purpureus]